ncbi:uncharacterized protein MONBRDRAFT_34239 [Monosiga brevicollis MX1]|uniref:Anaphase-promoting complex subunit 4 WD40 domain-containing protein n=1 Tax=Monosiga brevicollis TaxID=81824 RepID=A9VAF2_MONBE|nr:uncharacterized protein MONBRDRAFT_34239 [Monosiga brevicollis MX1]EDQ85531.1 predicted protein [Monosiga brevicollis MX1]|eukprot:XP_001749722.1 hypothetical protein [Monosiga brevicollis MX1]
MKRVFSVPGSAHGNSRVLFQWQKKSGKYLASAGANRRVNIYNREGNIVAELETEGNAVSMDWDAQGITLAVACEGSNKVLMWNSDTKESSLLETDEKSPLSMVRWSTEKLLLIIGTVKGNLILYNQEVRRRIPILGKHNKSITEGIFDQNNNFALLSNDRSFTINNSDGDTLHQPMLQSDGSSIRFYSPPKTALREGKLHEPKASLILDKKTLYIFNLEDPENPIELAFQEKYGTIVAYDWSARGNLYIGFSSGYFVSVSTHMDKIGQELFQVRNHKTRLNDIACCHAVEKVATAGDDFVKIHDMLEPSDVYAIIPLEDDRGMLDRLRWSEDGQLLTISTMSGAVYTYLMKLPVLGQASSKSLAYMSSLKELTAQFFDQPAIRHRIKLPIEPLIVGAGPFHAAVAMNNNAWFYTTAADEEPKLVAGSPRDYVGTVDGISLNADYAAVQCGGKLQLQLIEYDEDMGTGDGREAKLFPEKSSEKIIASTITEAFLIYATDKGGIHYFSLEDWMFVNEYQLPSGIKRFFADETGTRVVVVDNKGDAFVYSPVDDSCVEIPNVSPTIKGFLWDTVATEKTLLGYDDDSFYVYAFLQDHVDSVASGHNELGSLCQFVGKSQLAHGCLPVRLVGGAVTSLTPSGKPKTDTLSTHRYLVEPKNVGLSDLPAAMEAALQMGNFPLAAILLNRLLGSQQKAPVASSKAAEAALKALDIASATTMYRLLGKPGMVRTLKALEFVEDRHLLGGHVSMLLGKFNRAEQLFLNSSQPEEALHMHRDLLQWEQALKLASKYSPKDLPIVAREYAQQLEFQGNFSRALEHYQTAQTNDPRERVHNDACKAGIARCALRTGDVSRGLALAEEIGSIKLFTECGAALEATDHFNEAAQCYERANMVDKAAEMYIKTKNWVKAGEMLESVSNTALQLQYAKAREASGSYKEAATAYEAANDVVSVVRINLDHLRDPQEAVRVVRASGSVEGAKMVANFFQKIGDAPSAIQFLIMSRNADEAYAMAKQHNQLDLYAEALGDAGTPEVYKQIAEDYDRLGNGLQAGRFFLQAGLYDDAVNRLVQASTEDGEHVELAIRAAGEAGETGLTQRVLDYLMGEVDGVPKDSRYLFRLYLETKQYQEASRTAILVAREEQRTGTYRTARDVLYQMFNELKEQRIGIPAEMSDDLNMLHSYILGKIRMKLGDHLLAARMLNRVANSISRFPAHEVNILTTTVIECFRSGMKKQAFDFAKQLLANEYRDKLEEKYKKKIESIVRKRDLSEVEEEQEPCPYCSTQLPVTSLSCYNCQKRLPMCIATGNFCVRTDFTQCPSCRFPARKSAFLRYLQYQPQCSMCSTQLDASKIKQTPLEEVEAFFEGFQKDIDANAVPVTDVKAQAEGEAAAADDDESDDDESELI